MKNTYYGKLEDNWKEEEEFYKKYDNTKYYNKLQAYNNKYFYKDKLGKRKTTKRRARDRQLPK